MKKTRWLAALTIGAASLVACTPAPDAAPTVRCSTLHLPTGIYAGTSEATMYGELCVPDGVRGVIVAVPGASYTSAGFQYQPDSFVQQSWGSRWATLAIDRPGHGFSTPLKSDQPTAPVVSDALYAVVHDLAAGRYGDFHHDVIMLGHSAGTALTLFTVQRHPDLVQVLAGIALTGMVHAPKLTDVAIPAQFTHPANQEQRFAGLDDGWMTTVPGVRAELWWSPAASPFLTRQDEATKDTWSTAELTGARELWATPLTVRPPRVLVIAGELDNSFCALVDGKRPARCASSSALLANERGYFPPGTPLDVSLVPGQGHVLSASFDASGVILRWAGRAA